jgi:predicted ATP-grasp superfamily ATP-dependent carboligase
MATLLQRRAERRNRVVIASHNINSNALKELSNELTQRLGYKVWRVTPDRVNGRRSIMFHPGIDKVQQFQNFSQKDVSSPAFATTLDAGRALDSKLVVVRLLTSASEGRGISIVERENLTQIAPLYTEYISKKKEFRVHVFNNKVIDVQEKRRKRGLEEQEFKVRNTANGYVFCRTSVVEPDDLRTVALAAVAALNRDQGAVDVIWNEKQNKCYVLEVNSRPGMQGTTLKIYADAVMEKLNG